MVLEGVERTTKFTKARNFMSQSPGSLLPIHHCQTT